MAENKTVETDASVDEFLEGVENQTRRRDARTLLDLMKRVTGVEPKMWGPSIIGFGTYHYQYDSGREGDMPRVGFSPRKASLSLYLTFKDEEFSRLLAQLGKHKMGASCIYINKLDDVDLTTLEALVARSWRRSAEQCGPPTAP